MSEIFFEGLSEEEIEKIESLSQEVKFNASDVIYRTGDAGDSFFLIIEGEVSLQHSSLDPVQVVGCQTKGHFFGETEVIQSKSRLCDAVCKQDTLLWVLSKSNFDMMLKVNPFISLKIMRNLSRKLRPSTGGNDGSSSDTRKSNGSGASTSSDVPEAKVITFFSPTNHVGLSTIALNLAGGLSGVLKKRVCLLDLDLQFGDVRFMLFPKDAPSGKALGELVEEEGLDDKVLKSYITVHEPSNLHVLLAPTLPEQSELIQATNIQQIISVLKPDYDYIIIDTHSSFSEINLSLFDLSERLYFVINPDSISLRHVRRSTKILKQFYPESFYQKIEFIINQQGRCESSDFSAMVDKLPEKPEFSFKFDPETFHLTSCESRLFSVEPPTSESIKTMIRLVCKIGNTNPDEYLKVGLLSKVKSLFGF